MNKLSEHDEKQLNLMINRLTSFENKQLDLSELVRSLEGLLHAMENTNNEWEEKFLNEFSTLESINAELPKMRKDEVDKLINEAVFNLKKLVEEKFK